MTVEEQIQENYVAPRADNEEDMPVEYEGDNENENVVEVNVQRDAGSPPRRKYLRGSESEVDDKAKNKRAGDADDDVDDADDDEDDDDDEFEEAEAGDEVKSQESKSEDEESVTEPPPKKRKSVRSVEENVSNEDESQGKKSKSPKKKKARRPAKRLTMKKSKRKAKVQQDTNEYEVEKIIDVKVLKNGKKEFLIRWKGFTAEDDTWEPETNVTCKELVKRYFEEHKEKIEAAIAEQKKNRKSRSKRRGSRGKPKTDSDADAEDSADGCAEKGKKKSKRSHGSSKKRQTRARNAGVKKEKAEAAATDSENEGDETEKAEDDGGEGTSQKAGGSAKAARKKGKHSKSSRAGNRKEYEVDKIMSVRQLEGREREYLIKWRGYSHKFNSWESEHNMNCDEKIEKFMKSLNQEPATGRQLRVVRKRTNRFVAEGSTQGRKLSVRLEKMPRKSYSELD